VRVYVYASLDGEDILAGTLFASLRRGREITTFQYDSSFLSHPKAYSLEPDMPIGAGSFAFGDGLPRSLRDASPDRWGRMLIEKGLVSAWSEANLTPRTITELDYLLNTSDLTRQGALRFKHEDSSCFEASGQKVPKLLALPELLAASNRYFTDDFDDDDALSAVKVLLDAGTASLGGARPKTPVIGEDGDGTEALYLAKFPHPGDQWNIMCWEKTVLDIAEATGIRVPERSLVKVDNSSVLLLKRFDREGLAGRIGYMSAMTALSKVDGDRGDYLDLLDVAGTISAATSEDYSELWLRVMLSTVVNNTDDHLRNHGFLREGSAWRLSPLFDVNPNPAVAAERVTALAGQTDFEGSLKSLVDACELFRLTDDLAVGMASRLLGAVGQWQTFARNNGATQHEIRMFAPVFERGIAGLEAILARLRG